MKRLKKWIDGLKLKGRGRKIPINPKGPGDPKKYGKTITIRVFVILIAVAIVSLTAAYFILKQDIRQVDTATFARSVRSGAIARIAVMPKDTKTRRYVGYYGKNVIAESDGIEALIKNGSYAATEIEKISVKRGISLNYQPEPSGHWSGWWFVGAGITSLVVAAIIVYTATWFLLPIVLSCLNFLGQVISGQGRQPQLPGQKQQKQKEKPKKKIKRVTFADVAGCHEAKKELKDIVGYLRKDGDKILYEIIGGKISKGILFHGPPGTGKTLLAQALAGEAGVPFKYVSGSEFNVKYVGVGADSIKKMMKEARENAPCIIFIDEIDALGSRKEGNTPSGTGTLNQTLNQLLTEMSGFQPSEGVIIIAATNDIGSLDSALTRGGRFETKICVGLPELKDRVEILKIHTKNKILAPDVVLTEIAKMCAGFSGADLESLTNEVAKLTIRDIKSHPKYNSEIKRLLPRMLVSKTGLLKTGKTDFPVFSIPHENFVKAWDTVVAGGDERPNIMNEREKRATAIHEAGHALIAYIRHAIEPDDANPLYKVSIIPRGKALGLTYQIQKEELHSMSKRRVYNKLLMLFGGWAAEKIIIGVTSTGVTQDLERATELVKNMVLKWGMSDNLPPMHLAGSGAGVYAESRADKYSGATEKEINKEIRALIAVGHQKAELMVQKNHKALDALVAALLEKESLNQEECERILSQNIPPENLKSETYSTNSTKKGEELL